MRSMTLTKVIIRLVIIKLKIENVMLQVCSFYLKPQQVELDLSYAISCKKVYPRYKAYF